MRIGRERGWPPRTARNSTRSGPARRTARRDPQTVAEKILFQYDLFGNTRYLI